MSGSGELGRVTRPGYWPQDRGLSPGMRPRGPARCTEPTPRTAPRPGCNLRARPHLGLPPCSPRPARPSPSPDTAGTKLLRPPRAQGVFAAPGGARGALGEGSTNPCTASRAYCGSGSRPGTAARAAVAGSLGEVRARGAGGREGQRLAQQTLQFSAPRQMALSSALRPRGPGIGTPAGLHGDSRQAGRLAKRERHRPPA